MVLSDKAADLNMVGFMDVGSGVSDAVGPAIVVGEKKQAFAGFVEPSDRG
jgi:hypothetical protein